MCNISLTIKNKDQSLLAINQNNCYVNLVYNGLYNEGDTITVNAPNTCQYLVIQLDDVMNPSFVFMKEKEYVFNIPFGEKKCSYNPKAFTGEIHLLKARAATDAEINMYKNLTLNEYDTHSNKSCFPHVYANVETRGESVFAARNAINGNIENHSHGIWPFESWGINRDPNAEITIDFGRKVEVDKVVLYTRSDFPHDNWWNTVTINFSDGTSITKKMQKSDQPHIFMIKKVQTNWIILKKLICDSASDSPFPALSQIEVYGIG